jgi:thioredoxin reductase (NADPH)
MSAKLALSEQLGLSATQIGRRVFATQKSSILSVSLEDMVDLAIIGAGPIGLEAAIQAKRASLSYVVLEKGCIVNAIYHYPTYMTFFTTSERLEIGGHPFVTATDKPTRKEALDYYRKVVQNEALEVRLYTQVTGIAKGADGFRLETRNRSGQDRPVNSKMVALATGYFDNPIRLGIPGEEREHVSHYYTESHAFYGRKVTIVGAGSSAADAALDLYRGGAEVTLVHRGEGFRHSLKYWIRPNLENRVKEGSIKVHFNTLVREITQDAVIAEKDGSVFKIPTDQTFLLTGYFASPELLQGAGVKLEPQTQAAELNEDTFETNVPGFYVIGSAGSGTQTSDIFIENGLVHVEKALAAMVCKLQSKPVEVVAPP